MAVVAIREWPSHFWTRLSGTCCGSHGSQMRASALGCSPRTGCDRRFDDHSLDQRRAAPRHHDHSRWFSTVRHSGLGDNADARRGAAPAETRWRRAPSENGSPRSLPRSRTTSRSRIQLRICGNPRRRAAGGIPTTSLRGFVRAAAMKRERSAGLEYCVCRQR